MRASSVACAIRGVPDEAARAVIARLDVRERELEQARDKLASFELGWPPGHFYSPIPSRDDLRRHEDAVNSRPASIGGIALRESEQLALLGELARYQSDQPFANEPGNGIRYGF